jgi:hypothetical protein
MQMISGLVVAAVAALTVGCTQRAADTFGDQIADDFTEMAREEVVQKIGPPILASLVGAGAPPAGPIGLLGVDAGWQGWADAPGNDDGRPAGRRHRSPPCGLRVFCKVSRYNSNP